MAMMLAPALLTSALALPLALLLPAAEALPPHRRSPLAVAHRGASGSAPENTLAAFRLATELGAAGFETDLHMTRDGEIVCLHDADIRRTTRGWPDDLPSYSIASLDWAFVSTLDAGSWFGAEFAGERVPLLREALQFARDAGAIAYLVSTCPCYFP
eukprot:COSAG04_NODE_307_length_17238_cov_17.860260_10_plen_157_part_00